MATSCHPINLSSPIPHISHPPLPSLFPTSAIAHPPLSLFLHADDPPSPSLPLCSPGSHAVDLSPIPLSLPHTVDLAPRCRPLHHPLPHAAADLTQLAVDKIHGLTTSHHPTRRGAARPTRDLAPRPKPHAVVTIAPRRCRPRPTRCRQDPPPVDHRPKPNHAVPKLRAASRRMLHLGLLPSTASGRCLSSPVLLQRHPRSLASRAINDSPRSSPDPFERRSPTVQLDLHQPPLTAVSGFKLAASAPHPARSSPAASQSPALTSIYI